MTVDIWTFWTALRRTVKYGQLSLILQDGVTSPIQTINVRLLIPFGKHKRERKQGDWVTMYTLSPENLIRNSPEVWGVFVGVKLDIAVRREFPDVGEFMDVSAGYSDT